MRLAKRATLSARPPPRRQLPQIACTMSLERRGRGRHSSLPRSALGGGLHGDNAFGVYHDINDNRFTAFTLVGPVGPEWQVMGFGPIAEAGRDEMLVRRSS